VAGVVVLGLLGDVAYAIYAAPQRNKPVSCRRRSSARSARRLRRSWRASWSRRRSTARDGGPASSAAR